MDQTTCHLQYLTFHKSLDAILRPDELRHPDAIEYMTHYNSRRDELARKLFNHFNDVAFRGLLPAEIIAIEWNGRMRNVSGCYEPHMRKIILSLHALRQPEQLRQTLLHEMCHAYVHIVLKIDEHHGPTWQTVVDLVAYRVPDIPKVTQYHTYKLIEKYIMRCYRCNVKKSRFILRQKSKYCQSCREKLTIFKNIGYPDYNHYVITPASL